MHVLLCLGHQRKRDCVDFGAVAYLHPSPVLVRCVLLFVTIKCGETEIFGCFMFSGLMPGAGWEGRAGCGGVKDTLGLGGILELAGVEHGAWDNLVG